MIDTLIGYNVYPYTKSKTRDTITATPKFYLFDVGVANYLSKRKISQLKGPEAGAAPRAYAARLRPGRLVAERGPAARRGVVQLPGNQHDTRHDGHQPRAHGRRGGGHRLPGTRGGPLPAGAGRALTDRVSGPVQGRSEAQRKLRADRDLFRQHLDISRSGVTIPEPNFGPATGLGPFCGCEVRVRT